MKINRAFVQRIRGRGGQKGPGRGGGFSAEIGPTASPNHRQPRSFLLRKLHLFCSVKWAASRNKHQNSAERPSRVRDGPCNIISASVLSAPPSVSLLEPSDPLFEARTVALSAQNRVPSGFTFNELTRVTSAAASLLYCSVSSQTSASHCGQGDWDGPNTSPAWDLARSGFSAARSFRGGYHRNRRGRYGGRRRWNEDGRRRRRRWHDSNRLSQRIA